MAVSDPILEDRNQLAFVQRWRALVDTQMHFNDMLMRTRSIGLSMVIAVYGAAIVSAGQFPDSSVAFVDIRLHVAVGIFAVGMLLLLSLLNVSRPMAKFVLLVFYAVPFLVGLLFLSGLIALKAATP
jgi:hypothetical protein